MLYDSNKQFDPPFFGCLDCLSFGAFNKFVLCVKESLMKNSMKLYWCFVLFLVWVAWWDDGLWLPSVYWSKDSEWIYQDWCL